jgi:hypothetical protein
MWVLLNEDNEPVYTDTCLLHFLQSILHARRTQMIVIERRLQDPVELPGMELYHFIHGSLKSDSAAVIWECICLEGEVTRILFSRGEYAIRVNDELLPSLR